MKKNKKIIIIISIILVVVLIGLLFTWVYFNFIDIKGSFDRDIKSINKIISKKYSDYTKDDIILDYNQKFFVQEGWGSPEEIDLIVEKYKHRATKAKVLIISKEYPYSDSMNIVLKKTIIGNWRIEEEQHNSGVWLRNETYYYGGDSCTWDHNIDTALITNICKLYTQEDDKVHVWDKDDESWVEVKGVSWIEEKKDYSFFKNYYEISKSEARTIINNNKGGK